FDDNDNEEDRHQLKVGLNQQRTADYQSGAYKRAGGVVDPVPADAPQFIRDYHAYYKTDRGYHARSVNSNDGWNVTGTMSFINQPINQYTNEIRSAVLMVHGDKAHSYYFSKDEYKKMTTNSKYTDNKEFMTIPG